VLFLDGVPTHELVRRLELRLECPGCFSAFRRGGCERCPRCAVPLRQRPEDDDRDKILVRHRRWRRNGPEIVSLYQKRKLLSQIDARQPPAQVLATALATFSLGA